MRPLELHDFVAENEQTLEAGIVEQLSLLAVRVTAPDYEPRASFGVRFAFRKTEESVQGQALTNTQPARQYMTQEVAIGPDRLEIDAPPPQSPTMLRPLDEGEPDWAGFEALRAVPEIVGRQRPMDMLHKELHRCAQIAPLGNISLRYVVRKREEGGVTVTLRWKLLRRGPLLDAFDARLAHGALWRPPPQPGFADV